MRILFEIKPPFIEIIWKHITVDSLIFIENLILYLVATYNSAIVIPYHGYISGIIWGCYVLALFFKLLFYFDSNPWSAVILNDVFSRPMSHSICIFGPRDVRGIDPLKNDVLATEQEQLSLVEILP